jgi:SAM-dependent methyltransferase
MRRWTARDISDEGERVSHLQPDFLYFAHLSIYHYALPLVQGAAVLDVGCGSGYGAAYLARHGAASVLGVDVSESAIAFSQEHFAAPNLRFRTWPAERIGELEGERADVVFSSNALEHVTGVGRFLQGAWRRLRPEGTMMIAVPPITNDQLLYENLVNRYHVNLWSPRQWESTIARYFEHVQPVLHGVRAIGSGPIPEDLAGGPVDERTFVFAKATLDDFYRTPSLTAIFVAERPRLDGVPGEESPVAFVDDSFSRPQGQIDPELAYRLRRFAPSLRTRVTNRLARAYAVWRTGGLAAVASKGRAALERRGTRRTTLPAPGKRSC